MMCLMPAEWRTVHAVKHGMTSRQIAERRGISIDAVKYHVGNAMAKLGVANRKELRHWHRAPKDGALKENTRFPHRSQAPSRRSQDRCKTSSRRKRGTRMCWG